MDSVLDVGDTGEFAEMRRHAEEQNRLREQIDNLIKDRRQARPPAIYTAITIATVLVSVADWVALVIHTLASRNEAVGAALTTHQTFTITITLTAVSLGVGWTAMNRRMRADSQRDELDQHRHDLQLAEIRSVGRKAVRAVRASGDAATSEILGHMEHDLNGRRSGGTVYPFPRSGS